MKITRQAIAVAAAFLAGIFVNMFWPREGREEDVTEGLDVPRWFRDPDRDVQIDERSKDRKDSGLVRALKSIEAQRIEAEATGANEPPTYATLGREGRLTTAAAEAAGLSPGERDQVEEILLKAWNSASARFATDAKLDEARSNSSEGFYVYQIRAVPDRGRAGLHEIQEELDSVIGEDRRKTLAKGLTKYDYFGGFGALDIEVEFEMAKQTYTYRYLNPETGKPSRFGTSALEEFPHQFGDTFDLSHFESGVGGDNQ